MSSPSKRRRTSPTTYVPVSDQENHEQAQQRPATPKRASYQSPTKASLARSNPKVLQQGAQAKKKRESEPNRRQSLLSAVLSNNRIEPEDGQEQAEQTRDPGISTGDQHGSSQNTEPTTLATDIANVFRDAPTPNMKDPAPDSRSPDTARQNTTYAPQRNDIPTFTSPSIVPRLVKSTSNSQQRARRSTSAELPPTPVQLGSDSRPSRPRGLAASSSPGGNGRKRVRTRGGHVTSSPLKPKTPAPPIEELEDDLDRAEIASGIEDDLEEEAQDQVLDDIGSLDEETNDPTIRDKQQQLKSLQTDLKALQEQCDKLERIGITFTQHKSKGHSNTILDENLTFLLNSIPLQKDPWPPRLEDHSLFQKNSKPYLGLFAPGNLRMSYQCWEGTTTTTNTTRASGRNTFVYQTTLAAPEPWPPDVLNLTFNVITDQETCEVVEIVFGNNKRQPAPLQSWIDGRLQHPVFNTDLASIVTGIGRYFNEDIKRASILKQLAEKLTIPPATGIDTGTGTVTGVQQPQLTLPIQSRKEALALLPYLQITQQSFSSGGDVQKRTRRFLGSTSTKQLMLTYDISLNWIGQPDTHVDICASGFSIDVMGSARKLFKKVEAVDGVPAAFEAVWEVLGMAAEAETAGADALNGRGTAAKKGKKKARRMTVFESPVKN